MLSTMVLAKDHGKTGPKRLLEAINSVTKFMLDLDVHEFIGALGKGLKKHHRLTAGPPMRKPELGFDVKEVFTGIARLGRNLKLTLPTLILKKALLMRSVLIARGVDVQSKPMGSWQF